MAPLRAAARIPTRPGFALLVRPQRARPGPRDVLFPAMASSTSSPPASSATEAAERASAQSGGARSMHAAEAAAEQGLKTRGGMVPDEAPAVKTDARPSESGSVATAGTPMPGGRGPASAKADAAGETGERSRPE